MRNPLLLLASTVVFTLSRASIVPKQDCPPSRHTGYLSIWNYPVNSEGFVQIGWAKNDPTGYGLGVTQDIDQKAHLYFTGCKNDEPFYLYCSNCDSGGASFIGTVTGGWDTSGNPNSWILTNLGPNGVGARQLAWSEQQSFKFDQSGAIIPLVFDVFGSEVQPYYDDVDNSLRFVAEGLQWEFNWQDDSES